MLSRVVFPALLSPTKRILLFLWRSPMLVRALYHQSNRNIAAEIKRTLIVVVGKDEIFVPSVIPSLAKVLVEFFS